MRHIYLARERRRIKRSRVVIVICPALEETVRLIDPGARTVLIENAPGSSEEEATAAQAAAIRQSLGVSEQVPVILYTGTFEAYQGLDLLFEAMAIVRASSPDARLALAGGKADQLARARERARDAGIEDAVVFAGERPAEEMPAYLLAADVLVSPRSRGTNTPLKIYQYLRSGKPIVATRLLTHTQVLTDDTAILTGATAADFAGGILAALNDRPRAQAVGRQALALADSKYTEQAYLERTRQACDALFAPRQPLATPDRAQRAGDPE